MGAEDHIEMRQLLGELLTVALADAATDGNEALREGAAIAYGNVFHRGHLAIEARISGLAHAAGHERDDVRLFDSVDGQRPEPFQHAGNALRIVLVHLASERVDAEGGSFEY